MADPLAHANLVAGHAVACVTAFLDGRHGAEQLAGHADRLLAELLAAAHHSETNRILDPVRILTIAMMHTARSAREPSLDGEARQERWRQVMGALAELVRHESRELRACFVPAQAARRVSGSGEDII